MNYKILDNIENYFDKEAKRIINIIYDDSNQFGFDTEDMLKYLDKRILYSYRIKNVWI